MLDKRTQPRVVIQYSGGLDNSSRHLPLALSLPLNREAF